ncbi:hypothetical protein OIM90_11675 [Streptomyces sp. AD16]|nr:hypothetical protein NQP46_20620 [Streptomyces albus]WDV34362.1 hypothetical protein OIM90_11675 [Streptomyces sp. AD16]
MGLQVVNTGQSAVNLADVKLRYWFTPDGSSAVNSTCDWAQLGCGGVTHTVEQASGSAPGASHYVEVGFASGSLAPGAATGEIQLRLNKADWSTFDESDDYSRSTSTGFTDHAKIGLYLGTALTWGTAPDPPPAGRPGTHLTACRASRPYGCEVRAGAAPRRSARRTPRTRG